MLLLTHIFLYFFLWEVVVDSLIPPENGEDMEVR